MPLGQLGVAASAKLGAAEVEAALGEALLLPPFDEYLLGYTERSAVLDPDHFAQIVPGRNGLFRPVVVVDGEVVGTWQRSIDKTGVGVEVAPFGTLSKQARAQLRHRGEEVGTHLGRMATVTFG